MSPSLALVLWLVFLLLLLRFDAVKLPKGDIALWLTVAWLFIAGSRLPSQWLEGQLFYTAESFSEGNALDRTVYLVLIGLSLMVLTRRCFSWGRFFAQNAALTALIGFGFLSVLWSDFPYIAFKRWFRDLGVYLVILLALAHPDPLDAMRWVLRRLFFLLIPLSIVLIKYFPDLAREYDQWTGQGYFIGATTSKNMLGVLCLTSGLFFFWDTLIRWHERKGRLVRWTIAVNTLFLAMTFWLLALANSATSTVSLVMGCAVIAVAHTAMIRRTPGRLTVSIVVFILAYLLLQFALGVDLIPVLAELVGRQPDLTGRTRIWSVVLSADINPLLGAGYESFWLGPRLQWVWERAEKVNHAHNGYLELYLNLGLTGLALLIAFLFTSFGKISTAFRASPSAASLALSLWTVLLFYNFTEAAFKVHLLWITFVLVALTSGYPRRRSPASDPKRGREPDRGYPVTVR